MKRKRCRNLRTSRDLVTFGSATAIIVELSGVRPAAIETAPRTRRRVTRERRESW